MARMVNASETRSRPALYVLATLVVVIVMASLFEGMSAIFFLFFSKQYYRPVYLRDASVFLWRTETDPWGAWHKPNAKVRDQRPCFDVVYTSNSMGARDVERKLPTTQNSAIFLGDSFIEGLGLQDFDRLTNRFEKQTGRPAINLASAGDVGPVQYWMMYRHFAPQFQHNAVVVGLFPQNDLTDNDPTYPKWKDSNRYRPYYKKTETGYEVFHKGQAQSSQTGPTVYTHYFGEPRLGPVGLSQLLHYTWSGGLLFAIKGQLPPRNIDIALDVTHSGYFETSQPRIDAVSYFLNKIVSEADGRNVYILIIPTYSEVLELRKRPSTWVTDFKKNFQQNRVSIIDLGPIFAALPDDTLRSAFLPCDGHWSALGNQITLNALLKAFDASPLANLPTAK